MTPLIVIPAAGLSSRMQGRDKLLELIDGEPLLRRQTRRARATGCPVIVCLPKGDTARHATMHGLDVATIDIPDAVAGMGVTLSTAARVAARQAPDRPFAILLPDVPGIDTADISSVLATYASGDPDRPTRATDPDGRPGTPLVLPARLLSRFGTLSGDDGGRAILTSENVRHVPFPDNRATRDLDTPEDWESWRKSTETRD